jgi:hypothetical protein
MYIPSISPEQLCVVLIAAHLWLLFDHFAFGYLMIWLAGPVVNLNFDMWLTFDLVVTLT